MNRYYFWNIWFVPDTTRDEHINIGILAGREGSDDWSLRLSDSVPAARLLDDANVLDAVLEHARGLIPELMEHYGLSVEGVDRMRSQKRNLMQLSDYGLTSSDSAEEVIERMWKSMIREVKPNSK